MSEEAQWVPIPDDTGLPSSLRLFNQRLARLFDLVRLGMRPQARTVSAAVQLAATVRPIVLLASAALPVTLPPVATMLGREVVVKRIGAGAVTVGGDALIDGAAALSLGTQWESVRLLGCVEGPTMFWAVVGGYRIGP